VRWAAGKGRFDACLGLAAAGNVSFLSEEVTKSLVVILVMLGGTPQQRQKATADGSRSGQSLHTNTFGAQYLDPRAHRPAGSVTEAYDGFLELPVPVVLVVLWVFGALLLGTALMAAYSAGVWLWAAIALL
jgi:hypothetical protein